MPLRWLTKLRSLAQQREAVFLLQVVVAVIAGLLAAVAFLDATAAELLIAMAVVGLMAALGYAIRYLLKW